MLSMATGLPVASKKSPKGEWTLYTVRFSAY